MTLVTWLMLYVTLYTVFPCKIMNNLRPSVVLDIQVNEPSHDSGIYKLTFSSGKFYIGKSIHIQERWKQHFDKFRKGKAAENMQREFDRCGYPETEVILECHPDHIDIMECYLINAFAINCKHIMLNTTYSDSIDEEDFEAIMKKEELIRFSTVAHCRAIQFAEEKLTEMYYEIKDLRDNGMLAPMEYYEMLADNDELKRQNVQLIKKVAELEEYRMLPWWKKLFV